MSALQSLSPQPLWQFFDQICSIPHPSKHEQALSEYIQRWAEQKGIECQQDQVGNLILRKPATAGMENRKGVILQAHLDMVPQANSDTAHDFAKDPILPRLVEEDAPHGEGEDKGKETWVKATGTTLGADNGIGMAAALAVLDSTDVPHGPVEVLLTIDEETGMTGAFGLEAGYLKGDVLINMDSEEEGEFCVGCAGGIDGNALFTLGQQAVAADSAALKLSLTGLKGGHSGVDIHMGRGNANKLLARLFSQLTQANIDWQLSEITGGSLRNAIPREAFAVITVPAEQQAQVQAVSEQLLAVLRNEIGDVEPNLAISVEPHALPQQVFATADSQRLLGAVYGCPNGVLRASQSFEGVVETSNNLGVISTDGNTVKVQTLIRSLLDTARDDAQASIGAVFELAGADMEFSGAYPGWKPEAQSAMLQVAKQVFSDMYGHEPVINVIHAGLECGLLKKVYPHWDAISFGPTIQFPHSPDEKVHVASVERFWQLLVKLLANVPAA